MVVLHITGDQLYADKLEHEPNADSFCPWDSLLAHERLYWHALASLENRQAEMREGLEVLRSEQFFRQE